MNELLSAGYSLRFTCESVIKTDDRERRFPLSESVAHHLVVVTAGNVRIAEKAKEIPLCEGQAAFFEDDRITVRTEPDSVVVCVSFHGALFHVLSELSLATGVSYPMNSELFSILEEMIADDRTSSQIGAPLLFTSRMLEFCTMLSKRLHSLELPASVVGIDGFSVDKVAFREKGVFHGRECVKITPNREKSGLVVLENYRLQFERIDPRHCRYMQMHYYFESDGKEERSARLRILNCVEEADIDKDPRAADIHTPYTNLWFGEDYCAPLCRNRWSSVLFKIEMSENAEKVLDGMNRPILRQIKIDPFGMVDSNRLEPNDTMYISSLTFYSGISLLPDGNRSYMAAIKNHIDEHYRRELPLSYYADACRMTVGHFIKRFKTEYGVTPHQYVLDKRLEWVMQYLKDENYSIERAARDAGFSDPQYFSRLFKKRFGMTPTAYRKSKNQAKSDKK